MVADGAGDGDANSVDTMTQSISMPAELRAEPQGEWSAMRFGVAAMLAAAAIYLTRQPWGQIFDKAINDEESTHIVLVPVAFLWIIRANWNTIRLCRPRLTWAGPLIMAVGWWFLVHGYDIQDNEFWFFGAIVLTVGAAIAALGVEILIRGWPAFVLLGFLIPVPGMLRLEIGVRLQGYMAEIVQFIGDIIGIVIIREGNQLLVNSKYVDVAEGCNGMRMVFGLFMVAYTFAFAMPLRPWVRALVLISAPAVALGTNLLRLMPTVIMHGYYSVNTAESFHTIAGYLMIPVAFFMLMGLVNFLEWAGVPVMAPSRKKVAS